MKVQIISTPNGYGFGYDWQLSVSTKKSPLKKFWLGQDVKFCVRVLGMTMNDVFNAAKIKGTKITDEKEGKRLGKFIVKELGLTVKHLDELMTWELACQ